MTPCIITLSLGLSISDASMSPSFLLLAKPCCWTLTDIIMLLPKSFQKSLLIPNPCRCRCCRSHSHRSCCWSHTCHSFWRHSCQSCCFRSRSCRSHSCRICYCWSRKLTCGAVSPALYSACYKTTIYFSHTASWFVGQVVILRELILAEPLWILLSDLQSDSPIFMLDHSVLFTASSSVRQKGTLRKVIFALLNHLRFS